MISGSVIHEYSLGLCYEIFLLFGLLSVLLGAKGLAQHQIPEAVSSESYQSMTFNGVWSWFSDPRAVYFEGKHKRTYAGWIDNYGDVHIGYYDHDTHKIDSKVIYDNLEIDDHNNPTILFDDDGRLLVFFNTHLQESSPLYMRTSIHPEDISNWSPVRELFLNDTENIRNASAMHHTYTNPVRLSAEDGNIYLFWRGTFFKTVVCSFFRSRKNMVERKNTIPTASKKHVNLRIPKSIRMEFLKYILRLRTDIPQKKPKMDCTICIMKTALSTKPMDKK